MVMTSETGGGALGDVMINLLGAEETLVATIQRPDVMRELRDRMLIWVKEMMDETFKIVEAYQEGSVNWLGFWAPGRFQTFLGVVQGRGPGTGDAAGVGSLGHVRRNVISPLRV